MQFFTSDVGKSLAPSAKLFPNKSGIRVGVVYPSGVQYEEVDSDVVCFRSAPADADGLLHTLVPTEGEGGHLLPPMATVTLERIDEPGEWEVRGLRVQRRLYTVSVSYRV